MRRGREEGAGTWQVSTSLTPYSSGLSGEDAVHLHQIVTAR